MWGRPSDVPSMGSRPTEEVERGVTGYGRGDGTACWCTRPWVVPAAVAREGGGCRCGGIGEIRLTSFRFRIWWRFRGLV